jgi:hypothetical protein
MSPMAPEFCANLAQLVHWRVRGRARSNGILFCSREWPYIVGHRGKYLQDGCQNCEESSGNDTALDRYGVSRAKRALRKRFAVPAEQKVFFTRLLLCDRSQPLLVIRHRAFYAQR